MLLLRLLLRRLLSPSPRKLCGSLWSLGLAHPKAPAAILGSEDLGGGFPKDAPSSSLNPSHHVDKHARLLRLRLDFFIAEGFFSWAALSK